MGNRSFFYSPTDAQMNCLKNNFKIVAAYTVYAATSPHTDVF